MRNCTTVFIDFPFWAYYVYVTMTMVSVATCLTGIAIMIHFKFYRSFNYRLILYQLISFLLFAVGIISAILWNLFNLSFCEKIFEVGLSFDIFIATYFLWSILLCTVFITAEIFSMVIFFVELRRAEIPTTIASFVLPLIPALVASLQTEAYISIYIQVTYVLGIIIAGVCIVPIAIAVAVLACRSLRGCPINNNNIEEQHLLHQHARQSYRTALKEILPFVIYPITILCWLLINFIQPFMYSVSTFFILCIFIINGNMGTISAIVFFIHIKILGRHKRNAFRCLAHTIPPINTAPEISEDQRFTVAGSITATHTTHFDPLGEDDIGT